MGMFADNIAWLVVTVLAIMVIFGLYRFHVFLGYQRKQELGHARSALVAHKRAIELLLDRPEPSHEFRVFLCLFSEMITEQAFAEYLLKNLEDPPASTGMSELLEESTDLCRRSPEIRSALHTAISSGLIALFLRWPEAAREFDRLMTLIATDDQKELELAQASQTFHASNSNGAISAAA